jgi:hypothetical protein
MAVNRGADNSLERDVVNLTMSRASWSGDCLASARAITRTERPIMYLAEERTASLDHSPGDWSPSESGLPPDPDLETAMDCLHILPLSILPLRSAGLRKARMIKNARLESVIELFGDSDTGSGQIRPLEIPNFFAHTDTSLDSDVSILEIVGSLQSFDVFSLRSELRRIDVGFEDYGVLALSVSKRGELLEFMSTFTRPLLTRIYGDGKRELGELGDIMHLLANPDRGKALQRLKALASDLGISISEIPAFIKQYGDVFLSISYFRQCLGQLSKEIPKFLGWMEEIRDTSVVQSSGSNTDMLNGIHHDFTKVSRSMKQRFQAFDAVSGSFWDDVNADTFRQFGATVTAQHVGIGAMLCGLTVKMACWRSRFPRQSGIPTDRLEFLASEMMPGLDIIRTVQKNLEAKAGMN